MHDYFERVLSSLNAIDVNLSKTHVDGIYTNTANLQSAQKHWANLKLFKPIAKKKKKTRIGLFNGP